MKPKYLVPVAMVIAAFLGGAAMQWLSSLPEALAGEPATRPVVESLQVRELVLVDEAGRQRAILRMEPDGPQFFMRDGRGNRRLTLGQVGPSPDKSWWCLSLADGNGKQRYGAHAHDNGSASGFKVLDNNGTPRFSLGYLDNGAGGIGLFDAKGQKRFGIGQPSHGGYSMGFQDESGETIWSAP